MKLMPLGSAKLLLEVALNRDITRREIAALIDAGMLTPIKLNDRSPPWVDVHEFEAVKKLLRALTPKKQSKATRRNQQRL